jgi:hypothetical protein
MDGFKKMHQPSRAIGMPILQQNRHETDLAVRQLMSALWGKAEMKRKRRHFRF